MKKIIKYLLIGLVIICIILLIIFILIKIKRTINYSNDNYYKYYQNNVKEEQINNDENNTYETVIVHTNKYEDMDIKDETFAKELIEKDSLKEEAKCNNNLKEIEEKIKDTTNIYGINLCEINEEEASKILNSLEYVYNNYPIIKDYVTNITLVNDGGTSSYIAAFKPSFTFATSNKEDNFPFIIKIQVFLNSSYYLNDKYLDSVIENAINTGHFPKDTTKESLIVHEFGHVLTYVLAIKHYNSINTLVLKNNDFQKYANTLNEYTKSKFSKKIVDESYNNYINKYSKISEEKFRHNISSYANTTSNDGEVLYNETIAEAFHDYYLHKEQAKKESLEIINTLNKYIIEN